MNGKEKEREYMKEIIFTQNCGVVLTHHHGVFLTLD